MEHLPFIEFVIQEAVTIGLTVLQLWMRSRAQQKRRLQKPPERNGTVD